MNIDDQTIIETDSSAIDGQKKCPKCGATDISLNVTTGLLRCNFCRHEFKEEQDLGFTIEIEDIEGQIVGSGFSDIVTDTNDTVTFKCSSCGAEVVIDTSETLQARCHWCRNTLSVNQQIPNGAIPDMVLPFKIEKEAAKESIETFVSKRKFYAHPKFKKEFSTENVMGVYFPYAVLDVNSHANFSGSAEQEVRRYTVREGENNVTYYDADLYQVERDFDLEIEGLTIETNSDRLNKSKSDKTNNIINSIMPFDIENCVKYDSNFLKGYSSERRDVNLSSLREIALKQAKDVARFAANETLLEYDRGVKFEREHFIVKGEQWKAAYLPVWLYSYQQIKGNKSILHYVSVNARTKETMGSVPIHMPKLLFMSFLVEILGAFLMILLTLVDFDYAFLGLISGFVYFFAVLGQYRNKDARHTYEAETKTQMNNLIKNDQFISHKFKLSNSKMNGANNNKLEGNKIDIKSIIGEKNE